MILIWLFIWIVLMALGVRVIIRHPWTLIPVVLFVCVGLGLDAINH